MPVKHMVIGLLFDTMGRVLLVQKKKPDFQKDKWNGVGGKVEPNEPWEIAMAREFREETGIDIPVDQWDHFSDVGRSGQWFIHNYVAQWDKAYIEFPEGVYKQNYPHVNDAGEPLNAYFLSSIDHLAVVDHMQWLLPLAYWSLKAGRTDFTSCEVDLHIPMSPGH